MMKPLYFVHIPKTAGTSFRNAAVKYFGKDNVVCDYGDKNPATSALVQDCTYKARDYWPLYRGIERAQSRMLCGHVPAIRYMPGMGVENAVVFLRDPVQRLVSEYQHFVRLKDYNESFRDFYTKPHNINALSRRVDGVPVQAFGALGLTERYEESLAIINTRYDLELKPLVDNTGRRAIDEPYEINSDDREQLLELNRKDVELYQAACELFEQRLHIHQQGQPYAHARLVTVTPKKVVGWAWWEKDWDNAVEVDVRVNGEAVARVQGRIFRPSLFRLQPPRGGYVEFSTTIDAKAGDRVDCVVTKTGQVFPPKPKIISQ